jgi:hypothetical protein
VHYSDGKFEWRHDTKLNNIHHNDTQHNGLFETLIKMILTIMKQLVWSACMQGVAFFIVILSIIMLTVIMLSDVAPLE